MSSEFARGFLAVAVAVAIALSARPARAEAEAETFTDAEIEAEFEAEAYPPPSARWTVSLAGLGTTAAFYGAALGMSYAFPSAEGASDLRVPLLGPWLAVAHNRCTPGEVDCSDAFVALRSLVTALDGIAQAGGLAIMLEGLFLPTQQVGPGAPAAPAVTRPATPTTPKGQKPVPPGGSPKELFWVPLPITVGARGIGLGIVGRF